MKSKRPSRFKFWLVILVGYVLLFVIGFTLPVAYGALTNKSAQTTAVSSTSSASSSSHKVSSSKSSSTTSSTTTQSTQSTSATSNKKKVVVQSGETAYAIATKYGLTVTKLQNLNPSVDLDNMVVGQELKIK